MTQDKKYIDRVYTALKNEVEGFNKTLEEFKESIKSEDYRARVYSALSDKIEGFNKTPEEFNALVSTDPQKKNSNSTGSQTPKGSQSKVTPKPSTSVGGKQPQAKPSATSSSQEFEYKPILDEKGKEVYYTDKKTGQLKPAMEKVPKGTASTTEYRQAQLQDLKKRAEKPIVKSQTLIDYENATSISDKEKQTLLQEIDDKMNEKGFLNGLTTGLKKFWNNVLVPGAPMELTPYSKEREEAVKYLTEEYGDINNVNPKEIERVTKEIVLDKKLEGLKVDKNNEFLSTLDEDQKKELNIEQVQNWKTLQDKDKYIATKAPILVTEVESLSKDFLVIKSLIEKHQKEGTEIPEEVISNANNIIKKFEEKANELDKLEFDYKNNTENIGSIEEEIDFLKRNYDTSEKFKTTVALGFGDFYINATKGLPLMIADNITIGGIPLDYTTEKIQLVQDISEWEKAKEIYKEQFKKDVSFENLSISNFGEFFTQELATQLPIFAQIALPGGIYGIGATTAGNKYGQMTIEGGYSKSNMLLTSLTFGTAEAVLGSMPTKGIMSRALTSFEKSGKRVLLREGIGNYVKKKGLQITEEGLTESVSEGLTQVVQNSADIMSGKKGVSIFDGVNHAMFSGGMLGAGMHIVPAVTGLVLKPFSNNKASKQVQSNTTKILSLQNELSKNNLSEASIKAINESIKGLEKENKSIIEASIKKAESMPKEVFDGIVEVTKKQEELSVKATEIKNDSNLSIETKKQLLESMEAEYSLLEDKRTKLVSGEATVLDALSDREVNKLKEKASKLLVKEAESKGEQSASFNDEQITKKAIEIYESSKQTTEQVSEQEKSAITTEAETTGATQQKTELQSQEKVSTTPKTETDAIQEQTTDESVLRPEQSEMGLQEVVEGDQGQEDATKQSEEKVIPGTKSNASGVEITYPTEDEAKARRDERSRPQYVQSAVETLKEEDTDTLKKELEGEFGLLTAENPMAQPLTEEENSALNNKAENWLKSRGYNPRRVVGKYGQAENSFFVPNLSKTDAIAFAKEFNQESVAHSEGLIYQDGSVNPRNKANDNFELSENYNEDSDFVSVVNTKDGPKTFSVGYNFGRKIGGGTDTVSISPSDSNLDGKIKDASNQRIAKIAVKAAKALSKVLPNLNIVLHNTNDSFVKVSGESKNQSSSGLYQNGTIHINLEKANRRTVAHEVFHAILLDKVKTDSKAADVTKKMIEALTPMLDKNKALKQRLQNFADNYEDNIQNEEKVAEFVGILAENFDSLSGRAKEAIKNWLNSLAKMFGVDLFESNEVLDVLNTIAKSVATGKEISDSELNLIDSGKKVNKPIDFISRKQVGAFDVKYTEQEKLDKLVKDGLVIEQENTSFMSNEQVAITSPDDMLVGTISIDGKQIFEGGGGVFFVTKYGDVWASGKEGTANALAKAINNSLKNNKSGKGYLVLTKGSDSKLISSSSGVNSSLAVLESMLDKNLISLSDFRSAVSSSIKTFGGEISLRASAKQMKEDINTYFSNPKESTFQRRGDVLNKIIASIAQSKSTKDNKDKIIEFLGGDKNKGLVTKVTSKNKSKNQSLSDLIAGVASEKLTKGLNVGDVYAIIEVNGEVVVKEDSHPSYPFHVVQKDGKKPILHLPKLRENGSKTITTSSGKPYSVGNVSIMSGKFNDVSTRKQKALPENVSKKLTETPDGKFVFKHYSDERRDVIKKGQGQNRITSTEESSALSAVGGLAMFYTMANQTESGVGNVEHTILIDKNKVYDIDSDPMGFEAEARERFNKVRPGQAFTNNYRGAFITQIANENGFDIAVSQWRGNELRAQTTIELKPEVTNTNFKERPLPTFSVGEVAMIDGRESIIEAIDGNKIKYRSLDGTSQGVTINNERNRRSLVKIEPTPVARKQKAFDKKRKAAITNIKGGKYGSLTNTSKSNKETIVEHETMKVKILNLAMLLPKIVEKAVDADLFDKYKNAVLAMSEKRLAAQTVITAKEVADLYDQIIGDYINFSEIQSAVLNDDINSLTDEQKDFYNENESLFNKPRETTKKSDEELEEKRQELKDEVMSYIPSIKESPKEYETNSMSFKIASSLADINASDLELLTNSQLENLRRVLETISLGEDIPAFANAIHQEIESNRKMVLSSNIAEKYNKTGFNKFAIRRAITSMTDAVRDFFKLRSNLQSRADRYPLVFADTANKVFGVLPKFAEVIKGKYGGIPIYTHIFSTIDKAEGALKSRKEDVAEVFEKVNKKLLNKSKNIDDSYRKIHFAFLQVQAWANPGNKKVKNGVVSFSENFNNSDSPYSDKEKKAYREFVNKYKGYQFVRANDKIMVFDDAGNNVTNEYFTKEELEAYNAIRSELDNQKKRAEETSLFNNNNALPFVNEYFPENNFSKKASAISIKEDPLSQNFSSKTSVKSKSLLEKTAVAHPVMHNPFAVAMISINGTEMQYQLLNPIQIARKTMSKIIADNNNSVRNSEGKDLKRYNELGKVYDNIERSLETLVEHLKGANFGKADTLDKVYDNLTNIFYTGALASASRTVVDLALNYQHLAVSQPVDVQTGFKERGKINKVIKDNEVKSADSAYRALLKYISASQINRVMGVVNLTSIRSEFQSEGANENITRRGVESDFGKIKGKIGRVFDPISSSAKLINQSLISVSDNMPALNFFLGSFANEFKDATGQDFDWSAAINNDGGYMLENAEAINHASNIANFKLSSYLGSSNVSAKSPTVVSAMRGQSEGKILSKLYKRANYLFRQFTMGSNAQFLSSLNNLIEVTNKKDASEQARIMVGNYVRVSAYQALSSLAVTSLWGLLRGDDEDEDIIRENSDELSNDSAFIKNLYTIDDQYKKYKESLKELDPYEDFTYHDLYKKNSEFRENLIALFDDKRFRSLFDANYRFYAREMFTNRINTLSANTKLMRKYSEETIKDIMDRIDSGDKKISQIEIERNLAYLNSEIGRSLINMEDREDYIEKIEEYLVDVKYYLLSDSIGGSYEFDPTTEEGSFKLAALSVTVENLLKHRDNSFGSNLEKGMVETGVSLFTGVRGTFPQKGTSYVVELINKKKTEIERGYYDFDRDRYSYGTPDIMLSDKDLNVPKLLEALTPPELTLLIRSFQRNRETDAALIALRVPGISDLNRIGGAIKKDDVYKNARGKFIENEMKKFLERKLIITEKEKKKKAEEESKYNSKLVQDKDKIRRVTK